jgi:hypothetical protein
MIVHLIDGTYELFRHLYGQRRGVTLLTSGLLLRVMLTEAEKSSPIIIFASRINRTNTLQRLTVRTREDIR